jgi:hypothetical protein
MKMAYKIPKIKKVKGYVEHRQSKFFKTGVGLAGTGAVITTGGIGLALSDIPALFSFNLLTRLPAGLLIGTGGFLINQAGMKLVKIEDYYAYKFSPTKEYPKGLIVYARSEEEAKKMYDKSLKHKLHLSHRR